MKRRILLVDDELAILLTLKAVLEINGFDVETAASAREAKLKLRNHEYHMVITDLRMESDSAGMEVVAAAKKAPCRPAVAMLSALPVPGFEGEGDAEKLLVKPMNTSDLLRQLEAHLVAHEDSKRKNAAPAATPAVDARKTSSRSSRKTKSSSASVPRKPAAKSSSSRKTGKKTAARKLAQAR
ncbi:MAG TPA: response regulator [Alloacidobacterium sp.]|nr:response regulator [Alloacidobacterium sp.]